MKKFIALFSFVIYLFCCSFAFAEQSFEDKKKEIIALYSSNNLEEAYKMISKITEDERDYELWYLLGNLAQDFNNDANASFYLQKSILLKPDFDKAHYNLGNIYFKEKKYHSAVYEYKLAIKYKKDFAYYYYNLGCAYLELQNYRDAKNSFEKAVRLNSGVPDFYYNLAIAYKNLGRDKEMQEAADNYQKLKNEK